MSVMRFAWWVAASVLFTATAQAQPKSSSLLGSGHVASVPGFPNVACGGPSSNVKPECQNTVFHISTARVPNPNGGTDVCIAYFSYNTLKVVVGKSNGGAELYWDLLDKKATFNGNGITFIPPAGHTVREIVASQGPGSAKIKGRAILNIQFSHQPNVSLDIDGNLTPCVPIDPGIIVNSN